MPVRCGCALCLCTRDTGPRPRRTGPTATHVTPTVTRSSLSIPCSLYALLWSCGGAVKVAARAAEARAQTDPGSPLTGRSLLASRGCSCFLVPASCLPAVELAGSCRGAVATLGARHGHYTKRTQFSTHTRSLERAVNAQRLLKGHPLATLPLARQDTHHDAHMFMGCTSGTGAGGRSQAERTVGVA